jgi:ribose/xylose/arabinose/galactoside ABC-type transport system permease subunit
VTTAVFTLSAGMVEGINGVQTGPGATPFTRTPDFIATLAMLFVRLAIAAFVAHVPTSTTPASRMPFRRSAGFVPKKF